MGSVFSTVTETASVVLPPSASVAVHVTVSPGESDAGSSTRVSPVLPSLQV